MSAARSGWRTGWPVPQSRAAGAGAVDCGGCVALSFGFFLIAGLAGGGACLSSAADFGADFAACGASFICSSTMIGGNLLALAGKA